MTIDWPKMFDRIEKELKKNNLLSMHKLWKELDLAEKERDGLPGEANATDLEKITEGKKKLSDQILRLL
jgi:hypothetical protein